jgi:hypothetical protein
MSNIFASVLMIVGVLYSLPTWAGLISSCDGASKNSRPDWVVKPDYSLPGYYVGVGSMEKEDKSRDEQIKAAENNAKSDLVQRIEVTIRAENEQSTRISNQRVQQDALSKVTVNAEEVLRDLQIKGRWIDPDTCAIYTLMAISKVSVAQAKREKLMKRRIENFKMQLAEGVDRTRNRDIKVRRKYLEDAQSLLDETDFSLLPEELKKDFYAARLIDALAQLSKEASQVKGHMALVALNQDGTLRAEVVGKILDQLRTIDNTADRLLGDCQTEPECISLATERGFSKLALLKTSSQVGVSQMGAYKGTLTITKTVFDIENHKKQGPRTASAQVIGWSNEELDWLSAVDKAMQELK